MHKIDNIPSLVFQYVYNFLLHLHHVTLANVKLHVSGLCLEEADFNSVVQF